MTDIFENFIRARRGVDDEKAARLRHKERT